MEDFLQLVAWLIVIVIVFFIFTGVKTAKTKSLIDRSEVVKTGIDADYLLINFLKQKTANPNAEDMAELIGLYYKTRDDKIFDEIRQKVNDYFSKSFLQTDKTLWMFKILDKEENEIKSISGLTGLQSKQKEGVVSSIILPVSSEKGDYIIIEISSVNFINAIG